MNKKIKFEKFKLSKKTDLKIRLGFLKLRFLYIFRYIKIQSLYKTFAVVLPVFIVSLFSYSLWEDKTVNDGVNFNVNSEFINHDKTIVKNNINDLDKNIDIKKNDFDERLKVVGGKNKILVVKNKEQENIEEENIKKIKKNIFRAQESKKNINNSNDFKITKNNKKGFESKNRKKDIDDIYDENTIEENKEYNKSELALANNKKKHNDKIIPLPLPIPAKVINSEENFPVDFGKTNEVVLKRNSDNFNDGKTIFYSTEEKINNEKNIKSNKDNLDRAITDLESISERRVLSAYSNSISREFKKVGK